MADGQDMIAGAFKVNSNQSWSATVIYSEETELEWCSLLVSEHENLLGEAQETLVPFVLGRNRSAKERRATVNLTSADCQAALTIVQVGADLYIELSSEAEQVECTPGNRTIEVMSNETWTVAVADGATADVSLDVNSGSDDGSVTVSFGENVDPSASKTATIVFTTASGIIKQVVLTQSKAVPYASVSADQLVIAPDVEAATLNVSANAAWSVVVRDASSWAGFVLKTNSGDIKANQIEVEFPVSYTPQEKKAVLTITPEGGSPIDVTLVQKGVVIILNFLEPPFTDAEGNPLGINGAGTYWYPWHGMSYDFAVELADKTDAQFDYMAMDDTNNIILGTVLMSYSWICLPAFQDMALTNVTVHHCATNKPFRITEKGSDKEVKGGESATLSKNVFHTWVLDEPKPNVTYALYSSLKSGRIREIKLIYR